MAMPKMPKSGDGPLTFETRTQVTSNQKKEAEVYDDQDLCVEEEAQKKKEAAEAAAQKLSQAEAAAYEHEVREKAAVAIRKREEAARKKAEEAAVAIAYEKEVLAKAAIKREVDARAAAEAVAYEKEIMRKAKLKRKQEAAVEAAACEKEIRLKAALKREEDTALAAEAAAYEKEILHKALAKKEEEERVAYEKEILRKAALKREMISRREEELKHSEFLQKDSSMLKKPTRETDVTVIDHAEEVRELLVARLKARSSPRRNRTTEGTGVSALQKALGAALEVRKRAAQPRSKHVKMEEEPNVMEVPSPAVQEEEEDIFEQIYNEVSEGKEDETDMSSSTQEPVPEAKLSLSESRDDEDVDESIDEEKADDVFGSMDGFFAQMAAAFEKAEEEVFMQRDNAEAQLP